ncbi:hypothetical protein [Lentzea albidocapillata]|uniref:GDSL-like Lipase/Acylhydrolase family protein n=1 Tax=Lentzea albidocapillata TaxID=40571 RepID=A0A1W2D6S6_9PSEU|nr:hypothetical protein [Lentzea albidocapillata]SMC93101.1 hypothetical protein SAMN05660733_02801 [Lentzea albidocapillata]
MPSPLKALCGALIAILLTASPAVAADQSTVDYPAASAGPVRVMPLGDSITQGGSIGGYRLDLGTKLRAAGHAADFAGSLADVFVLTIIPIRFADATVRGYNAAIVPLLRAKAAAGKRVHVVDMYPAVPISDLPDGIHPNAAGYSKMATVWFTALSSVPSPGASATFGFLASGPGAAAVGTATCAGA